MEYVLEGSLPLCSSASRGGSVVCGEDPQGLLHLASEEVAGLRQGEKLRHRKLKEHPSDFPDVVRGKPLDPRR